MERKEASVGEVVASGRVGREDREYTFLPLRARPSSASYAGFPGSVESEWTVIGYELCSRMVGSKAWRSEGKPKVSSMREALTALAEDLTLSDHVLIHPTAITMRNEIRDRERADAAENADTEAETDGDEATETPEAPADEPDESASQDSD